MSQYAKEEGLKRSLATAKFDAMESLVHQAVRATERCQAAAAVGAYDNAAESMLEKITGRIAAMLPMQTPEELVAPTIERMVAIYQKIAHASDDPKTQISAYRELASILGWNTAGSSTINLTGAIEQQSNEQLEALLAAYKPAGDVEPQD